MQGPPSPCRRGRFGMLWGGLINQNPLFYPQKRFALTPWGSSCWGFT